MEREVSGRGATASQRCAAQRGEAPEVGDDPDQWGPHVSEGREEGGRLGQGESWAGVRFGPSWEEKERER